MARTAYNPGEATLPVKIGPGLYSIDSFRGEEVSYRVNLGTGSCTCPHYAKRIAGTGGQCKHIAAARTARFRELVETARKAADRDLPQLLTRYEAAGQLDIALAIRCEMADRGQQVAA